MPTVLVTGASSGIGQAFAERYARDGWRVVAVARRRERLEELAARIGCEVVVADLGDPSDLRAIEARIAADEDLCALINNAGFGHSASLTETSADDVDQMIRVHVLALTRLARAAIPGMIARGRGDIVNLSSIASVNATPDASMVTYGATKAFVNSFTEGLAHQHRGAGLRVQALCASWTRTEIFGDKPWTIPADRTLLPAQVVDASLRGLELGEVLCFPTLEELTSLRDRDAAAARVLKSAGTRGLASRYRER